MILPPTDHQLSKKKKIQKNSHHERNFQRIRHSSLNRMPRKRRKRPKSPHPTSLRPPITPPDQIPTSVPEFDATNDMWVGEVACTLRVDDIATYPIADDEVLLEYSADGTSVRLIENFDFADIPLTRDGTSAKEIRRVAKTTPLRNTWVLAGSPIEDNQKTSNKAQEFATSEQE